MSCLVSVTRLRVRSLRFLPMFLVANERSVAQLRRTRSFREGQQLVDQWLTFWTVSSTVVRGGRQHAQHPAAAQQCGMLPGEHCVPERIAILGVVCGIRHVAPNRKLHGIAKTYLAAITLASINVVWAKRARRSAP